MPEEDLAGKDLRHQDLSNKNLFLADLRGAKLYGAKFALRCDQFDSVKLDDEQVAMLLLMITEADINPRWKQEIQEDVRWIIGDESYRALRRLLRLI